MSRQPDRPSIYHITHADNLPKMTAGRVALEAHPEAPERFGLRLGAEEAPVRARADARRKHRSTDVKDCTDNRDNEPQDWGLVL